MGVVEVSVDYGGRLLTLQTGKLAKQADASVLATYGDTMVLVAVVSSRDLKEGQDFFPLTVDFQEKYYAAGRLPGGFFKREAKPSDRATLSARMIDRPMRPLFPEDYLCETNVTVTVLSTDGVNETDLVATIAASAAMHISDIPWNGPIAACRVGMLDGEYVLNPPPSEQGESQVELMVSGVRSGVIMVEGSAKEVSEKQMMDAIDFAHQSMLPVMDIIDELRAKTGNKPKREYVKPVSDEDLKAAVRKAAWKGLEKAFSIREKLARYEALAILKKELKEKLKSDEDTDEAQARNKLIATYYEEAKYAFARELTLETKTRIDGRAYNAIRPISTEVGLLPRVHGSALFTRGETQVLSTVTLGTSEDEQKIDSISGVYQKTFMLHYNFPPFSVGEARPLRPPGRREIGHGFLAERSLTYVMPPRDQFPYTVRLVAEVLESNGSSSMASVCSGSLALMDAGVPLTKPVAGVAMGLIKEGEKVAVISDILGDEDHLGDMDFKVCGTAEGVTGFQMDLKIGGVDRLIMEQALEQAREGRLHILSKMAESLEKHREAFSPYAPRIFTIKIKPDKVREVIGSGGKVIRGIIEQTGVKIDIEDDGSINIASSDETSAQKAIAIIQNIVEEPEIGKIYEGRVSRIAEFGAFVEIIPGTDGLCHISELDHHRVRRVEDVVKEGDMIRVKCLDVDQQGKIRLSRKALLPPGGGPEGGGEPTEEGGERPERAPRERSERPERGDRPERSFGDRDRGGRDRDRGPRGDRPSRPPRSDRPERPERAERPERGLDRDSESRPERSFDRPPRDEGGPRGDRGPRPFRDDRPPREDRPFRDDRPPRDDRPARGDRPPRGDREDRAFGGPRRERSFGSDEDDDRGNRDENRGNREPRGRDRGPREAGLRDDVGNRDDRGNREPRSRDDRGPRGSGDRDRGPRGPREDRAVRGPRDDRGPRSGGIGGGRGREPREPREPREGRPPREFGTPREPREPRDSNDERPARLPRELHGPEESRQREDRGNRFERGARPVRGDEDFDRLEREAREERDSNRGRFDRDDSPSRPERFSRDRGAPASDRIPPPRFHRDDED